MDDCDFAAGDRRGCGRSMDPIRGLDVFAPLLHEVHFCGLHRSIHWSSLYRRAHYLCHRPFDVTCAECTNPLHKGLGSVRDGARAAHKARPRRRRGKGA